MGGGGAARGLPLPERVHDVLPEVLTPAQCIPWTPPREVLSVWVFPDRQAALKALVDEWQTSGSFTGIKPGTVLEHLTQDLLSEEGRAKVRRERLHRE
ncbi:hypothetical protein [Deinococcus hopiensis]|uniref:Uncharacterized protein n=1 Tax=Deinococcus hopiensis KR-140 TaxID=695939 RepID=A0A1W1UB17_9DEIO|nr:hypothetical protein [Deinococcus hopiensis]SMB78253.1 hypothetical protein SAMN00790413_06574 [Deinococcus hopiensis KR-140]